MNLCILFYPNDGDQATISHIDYIALSASIDQHDQIVALAIKRALMDPDGVDTVDAEAYAEMTTAGNLTLPYRLDKEITLYLD